MQATRRLFGSSVLLVAMIATGCDGGPPIATIAGKITRNGQPPKIPHLTISFVGANGKPVTTAVSEDGSFTADPLDVGEMMVGFGIAEEDGSEQAKQPQEGESAESYVNRMKHTKEMGKHRRKVATKSKFPTLPIKYLDPRTSGITTTLKPGANTFDFDIK